MNRMPERDCVQPASALKEVALSTRQPSGGDSTASAALAPSLPAQGLALASAAAVTGLVRTLLGKRPPGGQQLWERRNHQGEPISMLEGPAVASGLLAGLLVAPDIQRMPHLIAVAGAAACGIVDDIGEDTTQPAKGLKGHLGSLMRGQLTTGGVKVLGIGASALMASLLHAASTPAPHQSQSPHQAPHWPQASQKPRASHKPQSPYRSQSGPGLVVDIALNTALIAGCANLINLLDLRPGRALKATALLASLPVPGGRSASCAALGAVAGAWHKDLSQQDMLGDGGANALGALVGARLAFSRPGTAKLDIAKPGTAKPGTAKPGSMRAGSGQYVLRQHGLVRHRLVKVAALTAVTALTLASEKVSFSAVISKTPWLRRLDEAGRRPKQQAGAFVDGAGPLADQLVDCAGGQVRKAPGPMRKEGPRGEKGRGGEEGHGVAEASRQVEGSSQ